jgi:predicted nuclease of predicted toxin-antitoxin system
MRFIIDTQLPYILATFLKKKGYDVIHTFDLPNQDYTTDNEIRELSVSENRVVITKDSDFLDSFYVKGIPSKLLLVSTGNIKNKALIFIFETNFERIVKLFETHNLIEIDNFDILGHE